MVDSAFDLMNRGALGSTGAGDTGSYNNGLAGIASAFTGVNFTNAGGMLAGSSGFADKQILNGGILSIFAPPKKGDKVQGVMAEIHEAFKKANANSGIGAVESPGAPGGGGWADYVSNRGQGQSSGPSMDV